MMINSYFVASYGRYYPSRAYACPTSLAVARKEMRQAAMDSLRDCRKAGYRGWIQVVDVDSRIVRMGTRAMGTHCAVWDTFNVRQWNH